MTDFEKGEAAAKEVLDALDEYLREHTDPDTGIVWNGKPPPRARTAEELKRKREKYGYVVKADPNDPYAHIDPHFSTCHQCMGEG